MPEKAARRARVRLTLLVAVLALPAGCNSWSQLRGPSNVGPQARVPAAVPSSAELVAYLNDNARRMQSIESRDVQLDASMQMHTVGLTGMMICQKPKNFRLVAKAGGMSMADIGSNPDEFWFWVGKSDPPYLFHSSHQDFAQGRSLVKFPLQPDWVMVALGMAEYDPNKQYEVVPRGKTIELVTQTVNAQGRPVRQVTVFNRGQNQTQVVAHKILEANGTKEICSATITQMQQDPNSGAVYPKMVQLAWPEEQMKLKMRLDDVVINNQIDPNRSAALFTRPYLQGVQSYNMAIGPDSPGSLQRMGNYQQR
jgi:hypothetical protein